MLVTLTKFFLGVIFDRKCPEAENSQQTCCKISSFLSCHAGYRGRLNKMYNYLKSKTNEKISWHALSTSTEFS